MSNLPTELAHPGGFVEDVMGYINETAVCEQPLFALGAALSVAGILYGRKVQSESGQRTNLFVMTVGHTSCGKDHALKSIARILDAGAATDLRLGQVTSDSAIEWALKRQPRQIALIDEAGHFFSGISDPSAKGTAQHAIKPALLELWSSANSRWKGKQRVPKDGKTVQPPVEIDSPHFCLFGTTQPQTLFESMGRSDLQDGWLPRNLFFVSMTRPKPEVKPIKAVPNSIIAEVLAYKNTTSEASVATIITTPAAKEIFDAFNASVYQRMLIADMTSDETTYLYGKALENATRIALILAVSRAGTNAKIEAPDALFATRLVEYLISETIALVRKNISENRDEKFKKRLLLVITQAGEKGISKGELTRKTQFIRRAFRDEYISDLLEGEEIVESKSKTGSAIYKIKTLAL